MDVETLAERINAAGKDVGVIPLYINGWKDTYGAKYWQDGFTTARYKQSVRTLFLQAYEQVFVFFAGYEMPEATGFMRGLLQSVDGELQKLQQLAVGNHKLFLQIDPIGTSDEALTDLFAKCGDADNLLVKGKPAAVVVPQAVIADLSHTLASQLTSTRQLVRKLLESTDSKPLQQAKQLLDQAVAHLNSKKKYKSLQPILASVETLFGGPYEPVDAEALKPILVKINQNNKVLVHLQSELEADPKNRETWALKEQARTEGLSLELELHQLQQQHRKLLHQAIDTLGQIVAKEKTWLKDQPKQSAKHKHIDFATGLNEEQKDLYDTWSQQLSKLSSGLSSVANKLVKQYGQRPVSLTPPSLFQQKLVELANNIFENNRPAVDKWVAVQIGKLQQLSQTKTRLLMPDESMGVVTMPVLVSKGYINPNVMVHLQMAGIELDRIVGSYQVIKNCLLVGVLANDTFDSTLDQVTKAYEILCVKNPDLRKLVPIGPCLFRQGHYYAMLVPPLALEGFLVESWTLDIAGKSS